MDEIYTIIDPTNSIPLDQWNLIFNQLPLDQQSIVNKLKEYEIPTNRSIPILIMNAMKKKEMKEFESWLDEWGWKEKRDSVVVGGQDSMDRDINDRGMVTESVQPATGNEIDLQEIIPDSQVSIDDIEPDMKEQSVPPSVDSFYSAVCTPLAPESGNTPIQVSEGSSMEQVQERESFGSFMESQSLFDPPSDMRFALQVEETDEGRVMDIDVGSDVTITDLRAAQGGMAVVAPVSVAEQVSAVVMNQGMGTVPMDSVMTDATQVNEPLFQHSREEFEQNLQREQSVDRQGLERDVPGSESLRVEVLPAQATAQTLERDDLVLESSQPFRDDHSDTTIPHTQELESVLDAESVDLTESGYSELDEFYKKVKDMLRKRDSITDELRRKVVQLESMPRSPVADTNLVSRLQRETETRLSLQQLVRHLKSQLASFQATKQELEEAQVQLRQARSLSDDLQSQLKSSKHQIKNINREMESEMEIKSLQMVTIQEREAMLFEKCTELERQLKKQTDEMEELKSLPPRIVPGEGNPDQDSKEIELKSELSAMTLRCTDLEQQLDVKSKEVASIPDLESRITDLTRDLALSQLSHDSSHSRVIQLESILEQKDQELEHHKRLILEAQGTIENNNGLKRQFEEQSVELVHRQQVIESLQNQVSALTLQISNQDTSELESKSLVVEELSKRCNKLESTNLQNHQELELLREQLAKLSASEEKSKEIQTSLNEEVSRLNEELSASITTISEKDTQYSLMETQINEKLQLKENLLSEMTSKASELEKQYEEASKIVDALKGQITELETFRDNVNQMETSRVGEVKDLKEQVDMLQRSLQENQTKLDQLYLENQNSSTLVQQKESIISNLESSLLEFREQSTLLKSQLQDHDNILKQNDAMKEDIQRLNDELKNAKLELEKVSKEQVSAAEYEELKNQLLYHEKQNQELTEMISFNDQEMQSMNHQLQMAEQVKTSLDEKLVLVGAEIEKLQESLNSRGSELKVLKEENQMLKGSVEAEVKKQTELLTEKQSIEKELRDLEKKQSDMNEKMQEIESSKAKLMNQLEESSLQLKEYSEKDASYQQEISKLQNKVESLTSRLKQMEGIASQAQEVHGEAVKMIQGLESDIAAKSATISDQLAQIGQLEVLESKLGELQIREQELIGQVASVQEELDSAKQTISGLEQHVNEISVERDQSLRRITHLEEENDTLKTALDFNKAENEDMQKAYQKNKGAVVGYEKKIAQLEKQIKEHTSHQQTLALLDQEIKGLGVEKANLAEKVLSLEAEVLTLTKAKQDAQQQNAALAKEVVVQKQHNSKLQLQIRKLQSETPKLEKSVPTVTSASPTPAVAGPSKKKKSAVNLNAIVEDRSQEEVSAELPSTTIGTVEKKSKKRRESVRLDMIQDENSNPNSDVTPVKKRSKHGDETPDSTRRTRMSTAKYVICLSGFKDNTPFSPSLRAELVAACKQMPDVYVLSGTEGKDIYNDKVTHLICPPETKTLKTLAAILSGAWIITDPKWVFDSAKGNKMQEETKYGFRCTENPITGKTVWFSPEFKELCKDKTKQSHSWIKFMELLWVKCAKGKIVQSEEADFVMVPDGKEDQYQNSLTWHQFMTMVPSQ